MVILVKATFESLVVISAMSSDGDWHVKKLRNGLTKGLLSF